LPESLDACGLTVGFDPETGGPEEMKYPVVYEKSAKRWGAYIPDLPGCGCAGIHPGRNETPGSRRLWKTHLRSMREDGDPIPEPSHVVDVMEVA
jgi:predicted RNase H-like HicB family nuclease